MIVDPPTKSQLPVAVEDEHMRRREHAADAEVGVVIAARAAHQGIGAAQSAFDAATGRLPVFQLFNRRLMLRASLDAIGTVVYLTALFRMPLGNATAINMATPLLITLMAVFAFREQVGLARWLAIAAGFGGVLLIVQPTAAGFSDGNTGWTLLCLGGTVLLSMRDLLTRVIPAQISSLLVALSAVLAIPLLAGVILLFQGWQPVTLRQLGLLAGAGAGRANGARARQ